MSTAAERVKNRLRPDGRIMVGRPGPFANSLYEDLTELLADYNALCELAGSLASTAYDDTR
jgi:hypothetical protein